MEKSRKVLGFLAITFLLLIGGYWLVGVIINASGIYFISDTSAGIVLIILTTLMCLTGIPAILLMIWDLIFNYENR